MKKIMDDWESDIVPRQFETPEERLLSLFCNASSAGDLVMVCVFKIF